MRSMQVEDKLKLGKQQALLAEIQLLVSTILRRLCEKVFLEVKCETETVDF